MSTYLSTHCSFVINTASAMENKLFFPEFYLDVVCDVSACVFQFKVFILMLV